MPEKTILAVIGTRPEALKVGPLVCELRKHSSWRTVVCVTEQHREMLHPMLEIFGIVPEYNLHVMQPGQSLADLTARILTGMQGVMKETAPDILLVQGDTTTAYAAALAGFYARVPVAHIEAGLRTYRMSSPFPEEFNRQSISRIASLHFAPTEAARENLLREGTDPARIRVTGNTGIDSLRYTVRDDYSDELTDWAAGSRLLVITAHRRENLGEGMHSMFRAIRRIVEETPDVKAVYPVHPNPAVRKIAAEELGNSCRIRLTEPLDAVKFHNLMARSYLILTDSGGIQEEAPGLGKPVLVMRDTTERPEGVAAGTLRPVGTSEETIYAACRELLDDKDSYQRMSTARNPYGDGFASQRIAQILEEELKKDPAELLLP